MNFGHFCVECFKPVEDADNYCANCGVRLPQARLKAVLIGICGGIVLGLLTVIGNRLLSIL